MASTPTTPARSTSRCAVSVLPMLPLGAPMGLVVFRDLAGYICSHLQSLASTTNGHTNAIHVFLYRADLSLEAFPEQTSWRFLSTKPLSHLLHRLEYPAPMTIAYEATIHDCFGPAPDITTPHDPPRVIHLMAEVIECSTHAVALPKRVPHVAAGADTHGTFGSLGLRHDDAVEPAYFTIRALNVPAVAGLTLPENKLFVRKADETLLDEILADLPDKKRFVYVAATSGAGKTAFLWSILHALCRRGRTSCGRRAAPPMDIVLDVPGLFVLIDTAG